MLLNFINRTGLKTDTDKPSNQSGPHNTNDDGNAATIDPDETTAPKEDPENQGSVTKGKNTKNDLSYLFGYI